MTRPLRIEFAGALSHITSRVDGREDIHLTTLTGNDFYKLAEVTERYNWVINAYCLVCNHYRLLVETPDSNCQKECVIYTEFIRKDLAVTVAVSATYFMGCFRHLVVEKRLHC